MWRISTEHGSDLLCMKVMER